MKNFYLYSSLLAITFALYGCSKFDETISPVLGAGYRVNTNNSAEMSNWNYREGELILGKKLQNPYTVENMVTAARYLSSQGLTQLDPAKIKASHYYVKFMPADSAQFEALENDRNLTLYPYPLDYEILQSGNHYRDPATPREGFAYQYAAVKVDYNFNPKIPYQIISSLYIPEEDIVLKSTENEDYLDRLLDRAYIQTGNFEDTIKVEKGKSEKKHPYNPAGKIQIFDTRLNKLIGLEGVDMRARRWFTTYHARTDFNGDYEMDDDFKRPCNYSLWFSQEDFTVKPHLIDLTAWIDGPKKIGDWDYDILSGYDRFVGHIFRGAYRYSYGYIDGLKRPYDFTSPRIWYIGVNDDMDASGNNYIAVPVIRISRYKNANTEYDSDEIFSATCHETAHTSHARHMFLGALDFAFVSGKIRESWAVGVEWRLTQLEYKITRGIPNYGDWDYSTDLQYPNQYAYQFWSTSVSPNADKYTNLFIDLVDDYNEYNQNFPGWGLGTVNDMVANYQLKEVEKRLKNINNLNDLNLELKFIIPDGVTNQEIDLLLSHY